MPKLDEKTLAYHRAWRKANPDKVAAIRAKHRSTEKFKATRKAYQKKQSESVKRHYERKKILKLMKTESIRLSDARRESLEVVAALCGIANQRGTQAGKPSWRALIYAIADGSVSCRPTKARPK